MRITLVIFSLVAGGAERVMATMANFFAARKGRTVTLLTLDSGDTPPFYPLDPAVQHRPLGLASISRNPFHALASNVHRVRALRRAIAATQPDLVISLMSETNVLTLFAAAPLGVPMLVQEQNDPHHHHIGWQWNVLRSWAYPKATHVVALNEQNLSYFSESVRKRGRIIPNPAVLTGPPGRTARPSDGPKTLMAMGRFVPQKGFDLLFEAFARIAPRHPDWSLEILGDGPLRADFETQIARLGLADRVRLPGITHEPHDRLRTADLFVMSSRHEGFPLSLCEALACGLPAVSFDCPTGPGDIIRQDIDGLLVPPENVAALSAALDSLMSDPQRREKFSARAPEVLDRYSVEKVMGLWEDLVIESTRA